MWQAKGAARKKPRCCLADYWLNFLQAVSMPTDSLNLLYFPLWIFILASLCVVEKQAKITYGTSCKENWLKTFNSSYIRIWHGSVLWSMLLRKCSCKIWKRNKLKVKAVIMSAPLFFSLLRWELRSPSFLVKPAWGVGLHCWASALTQDFQQGWALGMQHHVTHMSWVKKWG